MVGREEALVSQFTRARSGAFRSWFVSEVLIALIVKKVSNLPGLGVITALLWTYLEKAREEGVPAWLEATTEHAKDVYISLGFKLVETIRLAESKADKDGFRVEGGEGIAIYAMIAEPPRS